MTTHSTKLDAVAVALRRRLVVTDQGLHTHVVSYDAFGDQISELGNVGLVMTRDFVKEHGYTLYETIDALSLQRADPFRFFVTTGDVTTNRAVLLGSQILKEKQSANAWGMHTHLARRLLSSWRDYDMDVLLLSDYDHTRYTCDRIAPWYPAVEYLLNCQANIYGLSAILRWIGHPMLYANKSEAFGDLPKQISQRVMRRLTKYGKLVEDKEEGVFCTTSEIFNNRSAFAMHLLNATFGSLSLEHKSHEPSTDEVANIIRGEASDKAAIWRSVSFTVDLLLKTWLTNITHPEMLDRGLFKHERSYYAFIASQSKWQAHTNNSG